MKQEWDAEFECILRGCLSDLAVGLPIQADVGLRDLGLNSLRTVQLLTEIELHYGIDVMDELLTPENFATPTALWAVVTACRESQEGKR